MSISRSLKRHLYEGSTEPFSDHWSPPSAGLHKPPIVPLEGSVSSTLKRQAPTWGGLAGGEVRPKSAEHTFVAVVHAADGVRLLVATDSRRELVLRLAEYARQRCNHALRPDHARHLRGLLVRGEFEAAVELYFGLVGQRWDEEWLVTSVLRSGDRREINAVLGAVARPDTLSEPQQLRDAS